MMYIFQYASGVIDLRSDIPEGHENDPYITVDDDFTFLPGHTLELDFENNLANQIEVPVFSAVKQNKNTEDLIVDAVNDI